MRVYLIVVSVFVEMELWQEMKNVMTLIIFHMTGAINANFNVIKDVLFATKESALSNHVPWVLFG